VTTAVTVARPSDLMRAAALLGASADELGTAVAACRRAAAVPWVGGPSENYQERLSRLADGLVGMRSAFGEACDAVLGYARAVAALQPLAQEADQLERLPSEQLLGRCVALRAEVAEGESIAAARLIVELHYLTDRAPRVSSSYGLQHNAAHFAQGLASEAAGLGRTAEALFGSLPGVGSDRDRHEARHEVAASVADALQPWKQVRELYDALTEGNAWYAGGQLAGAAVFRLRGDRAAGMDLFGGHDELPDRVMLALRREALPLGSDAPVDRWLAQHLRQQFVDALRALENMPLPSLDELDLHGVDLVHHEAAGGHTLQRHVGRDPDFLRDRQRFLVDRDGNPFPLSSFRTVDEAEALITEVIRTHLREIRAFLSDPVLTRKTFVEPLPGPVGTVIDAQGTVVPAGSVVVRLVKVDGTVDGTGDGTVQVHTAYLHP
jgi:hypothetical protein